MAEWEGLGLMSGSSINDITTALSIFCSHYSSDHWVELLRQELPELTDEDIEWPLKILLACGLTLGGDGIPGTGLIDCT